METVGQGRLYRLAKRLSIERLLRYLALWARYVWRGQNALVTCLRREPATDIAGPAAALGRANLATAKRMAVASWFPRDLANAGLQGAIESNFLAADEDSLALRPLGRAYYQTGGVHTAYCFQGDMGTWLVGSPKPTSFDRCMRNTRRLLTEAAYSARAYASHMAQIVNKSLANEIFDRFVTHPDGRAYDEWSLYFNVAHHLYPRHFVAKPYGTLGWPMRPGDWLPEIDPLKPVFENYSPQNYTMAESGMLVGLEPLGDFEAKTARVFAALAQARRAEVKDRQARYVFDRAARGTPVAGGSVRLGEVCWIPLLPPDKPGLFIIRFYAALDSGARLEARALLTGVAGEGAA